MSRLYPLCRVGLWAGLWVWAAAVAQSPLPASHYGIDTQQLTMQEWRETRVEHKLLAAGEWAGSLLREDWIARNGYDQLGRRAAEIVLCMDESSVGFAAAADTRAEEVAIVCMTVMGWGPPG